MDQTSIVPSARSSDATYHRHLPTADFKAHPSDEGKDIPANILLSQLVGEAGSEAGAGPESAPGAEG